MNITDIKAVISRELGFTLPGLNMQIDKSTPEGANWPSAWLDGDRVRIVMHIEVLNKIKADPNFNGLALKSAEHKAAVTKGQTINGKTYDKDRAAYTKYMVITPNEIVAVI